MLEIKREELGAMIHLQENESEKNRIRLFLQGLPEQISRLDEGMAGIEERIQAHADLLARQKKAYRDSESTLREKQEQIKKSDQKLLSIKNNKEYQAVLAEIEDTKADIAVLEDDMLNLLFELEALEEALVGIKQEAEADKKKISDDRRSLEARQAENQSRLAALDERWREISEEIPDRLLDQYLEVSRTAVDGVAMAAADNFICQGCHMNIPPQLYNELYKTKVLRFCPFCSRILYYNGNHQEQ